MKAIPPQLTPAEAIQAHIEARHRAERMLAEAQTPDERKLAQFWVDSADRNITKWQVKAGAR